MLVDGLLMSGMNELQPREGRGPPGPPPGMYDDMKGDGTRAM